MPPTSPHPTSGRRLLLACAFALVSAAAVLALSLGGGAGAVLAAILSGGLGAALAWGVVSGSVALQRDGPAPGPGPDELRARAAMEALPDPLMLLMPDDRYSASPRIAFANAAARELFKIPREGSRLVEAIRRPEVLEAADESLFGGVEGTTAFETGGAQDRFWRAWTCPLSTEGRPMALLLLRDETDSRRNERMRADFLANASHELRTPLASIAGFVETLRGHAKDDAGARERFLHIMAGQADRMTRLIEDLLSLSRIELNEHIPPSGGCDLAFAVADVADAVGMLMKDRGIRLDLSLPGKGEALIAGDRDQILQVVQNLVDNAIKYSGPGGAVRVEVEPGQKLDALVNGAGEGRGPSEGWSRLPLLTPDRNGDQRYVRLRVTDSGPGIDRTHLPRLAERFYRVEGQKSGERSGTGLGLAIVKHIVNRHRGGLLVESAPGRGSTFTAYFPATAVLDGGRDSEQTVVKSSPPVSI
jgi:two-component system phosphate regulon sensor histidine kinase PhoR